MLKTVIEIGLMAVGALAIFERAMLYTFAHRFERIVNFYLKMYQTEGENLIKKHQVLKILKQVEEKLKDGWIVNLVDPANPKPQQLSTPNATAQSNDTKAV